MGDWPRQVCFDRTAQCAATRHSACADDVSAQQVTRPDRALSSSLVLLIEWCSACGLQVGAQLFPFMLLHHASQLATSCVQTLEPTHRPHVGRNWQVPVHEVDRAYAVSTRIPSACGSVAEFHLTHVQYISGDGTTYPFKVTSSYWLLGSHSSYMRTESLSPIDMTIRQWVSCQARCANFNRRRSLRARCTGRADADSEAKKAQSHRTGIPSVRKQVLACA